MSTPENASPTASPRDKLRASKRIVRLSASAALDRVVSVTPPIELLAVAAVHIALAIATEDAEA
jgi:hypothetical protein